MAARCVREPRASHAPRAFRLRLPLALALAVFAAGCSPALAQVPPPGGGVGPTPGGGAGGGKGGGTNPGSAGLPSREEIEKRIKEEFEKLPEREAAWGKIRILYKGVPSDPIEVIKASGQLPAGANADQVAKQYIPLVRPYIEKQMGEVGKFIADEEAKYKSTKLTPAEYTLGLLMEDLVPVAIRLTGKALKSPLTIPLARTQAQTPYSSLVVEVKEGKKEGDFTVEVGFGKVLGTAKMAMAAKK